MRCTCLQLARREGVVDWLCSNSTPSVGHAGGVAIVEFQRDTGQRTTSKWFNGLFHEESPVLPSPVVIELRSAMNLFQYPQALTIILLILAVVISCDQVSSVLGKRLI